VDAGLMVIADERGGGAIEGVFVSVRDSMRLLRG
jgi:hypothetical protein